MNRRVRLPLAAATLLILLGWGEREPLVPTSADGHPAFQTQDGGGANQAHGGRRVVTLKGAEGRDFDGRVRALGGVVERRHPEIAALTLRGLSTAAAAELAAHPDVESVGPDLVVQWIPEPTQLFRQPILDQAPAVMPQGPDQSGAELFGYQWNMRVIQAVPSWRDTPAGAGRLVCVLDTGVDADHIELSGKVDFGRSASFVEGEPTVEDFNAHGTFVASIISSNGIRLASVAPNARLCAVKVLGTDGRGTFADLIAGILFAVHQGADVVGLSLGAYLDLRQHGVRQLVQALQRAVDFANRHQTVVVAAAGNDTINLDRDSRWMLQVPAQLDGVISVGATAPFFQQDFDRLASYSNYGGETGIALVAPGGDLPENSNGFDLLLGACSHTQRTLPWPCQASHVVSGRGTSFAAPHVAGAAAVVASQLRYSTPGRLTACILAGADRVDPAEIFGAGRLNVARAAACQITAHSVVATPPPPMRRLTSP